MDSLSAKGFGENVNKVRKAARMSVLDFRAKSRMTVTRLVEIEKGRLAPVTLPEMVTIAKTLGIQPVELLEPCSACCKKFDTCEKACVNLSKHWKEKALAKGDKK